MLFARVSRGLSVAAMSGVMVLAPPPSQGGAPGSWRVDGGDVKVLVPMRPGGAFEARTSTLRGTLTPGASQPLSLTGELTVDLATIDTGIGLRNRHLRENYLDVSRGEGYDRAVLTDIVLDQADSEAFRGSTAFSGSFLLHGVTRPVTGKARIEDAVSGVHVDAEFVLELTDHEVEPPEYMGVGVSSRVVVHVSFDARPGRGR